MPDNYQPLMKTGYARYYLFEWITKRYNFWKLDKNVWHSRNTTDISKVVLTPCNISADVFSKLKKKLAYISELRFFVLKVSEKYSTSISIFFIYFLIALTFMDRILKEILKIKYCFWIRYNILNYYVVFVLLCIILDAYLYSENQNC